MAFSVGDRVCRDERDPVVGTSGQLLRGMVARRYSEGRRRMGGLVLGPYPELYQVLWDGGRTGIYLPHGIRKEVPDDTD